MVNISLNMCGQISGEGFAFSINNVGIIDTHMQKNIKNTKLQPIPHAV